MPRTQTDLHTEVPEVDKVGPVLDVGRRDDQLLLLPRLLAVVRVPQKAHHSLHTIYIIVASTIYRTNLLPLYHSLNNIFCVYISIYMFICISAYLLNLYNYLSFFQLYLDVSEDGVVG